MSLPVSLTSLPLKSSETKATHECLGGFKRSGNVFEEPESMGGPETASGYVWDRHSCTDRCCVGEVLVPPADKSHFALARPLLQEFRLFFPP